jgi:dGTPase
MALYTNSDWNREIEVQKGGRREPYRSPWRRDFARLIHSPSFRRLQGKTQVFPGKESDYFRNRLTHSLEVAQIAKSIAIRLNNTSRHFRRRTEKLNSELVEFAGLAHDLGHPPFGHNGEEALDECMSNFGGFEGNAQTLRILSRLEKKETRDIETGAFNPITESGEDLRVGLNITYRSLASILKYDKKIPMRYEDRSQRTVVKGYYLDDAPLVQRIKENVLGRASVKKLKEEFKSVECSMSVSRHARTGRPIAGGLYFARASVLPR